VGDIQVLNFTQSAASSSRRSNEHTNPAAEHDLITEAGANSFEICLRSDLDSPAPHVKGTLIWSRTGGGRQASRGSTETRGVSGGLVGRRSSLCNGWHASPFVLKMCSPERQRAFVEQLTAPASSHDAPFLDSNESCFSHTSRIVHRTSIAKHECGITRAEMPPAVETCQG
jgi:hypothetical protein